MDTLWLGLQALHFGVASLPVLDWRIHFDSCCFHCYGYIILGLLRNNYGKSNSSWTGKVIIFYYTDFLNFDYTNPWTLCFIFFYTTQKYGVLLTVCFFLEIAGVAYLLNNGTLWSNVTWWLRDRFYELIYVSDTNAREARILRVIQEEVIRIRDIRNYGRSFSMNLYVWNLYELRLAAVAPTVPWTTSTLTSLYLMSAEIKLLAMSM